MPKLRISDLRKSSVYITSNFPAITTKRYKVSVYKLLGMAFLYTLLIAVVVSAVIALTPAKRLVFILENEQLETESAKLKDLEEKIVFLATQIRDVSSSNKKLELALILAEQADSLDSTSAVYDTLKANVDEIIPIEGSVFGSLISLIERIFGDGNNTGHFFVNPVKGFVIYGYKPEEGHMGIDYGVKTGTPVYATAGGIVLFANYTIEDGYKVLIKHDDEYYSLYKHCSSLMVKERDYVNQGELIALSGNSGVNTSGPHLHFELWQGGKAVDPLELLINNRR